MGNPSGARGRITDSLERWPAAAMLNHESANPSYNPNASGLNTYKSHDFGYDLVCNHSVDSSVDNTSQSMGAVSESWFHDAIRGVIEHGVLTGDNRGNGEKTTFLCSLLFEKLLGVNSFLVKGKILARSHLKPSFA